MSSELRRGYERGKTRREDAGELRVLSEFDWELEACLTFLMYKRGRAAAERAEPDDDSSSTHHDAGPPTTVTRLTGYAAM